MPVYTWKDYEKPDALKAQSVAACQVWLLSGKEEYLRNRFRARLIDHLLPQENREWGLETFRLTPVMLRSKPPEGNWAKSILRAASTMPFFSQQRVVVVEQVNLLGREEQEELTAGLESLPKSTVIVLVTASGVKGKRSQVSAGLKKAAEKLGRHIRFEPLNIKEAIQWVQQEAQKSGKRIDTSAAALLVQQRLGTDLGSLKKEIEKLVLFAKDLPAIKCAQVEAMTPRLLEEKVFDLADAVALGKRGQPQALALVRRLLNAKEDPGYLLAILARHFRLIWQSKALLERGWRPGTPLPEEEEILRVLLVGKNSAASSFAQQDWQARKLAGQARSFTWPQLEKAILALQQLDLALKGQGTPPRPDPGLALEVAIVSLAA